MGLMSPLIFLYFFFFEIHTFFFTDYLLHKNVISFQGSWLGYSYLEREKKKKLFSKNISLINSKDGTFQDCLLILLILKSRAGAKSS